MIDILGYLTKSTSILCTEIDIFLIKIRLFLLLQNISVVFTLFYAKIHAELL